VERKYSESVVKPRLRLRDLGRLLVVVIKGGRLAETLNWFFSGPSAWFDSGIDTAQRRTIGATSSDTDTAHRRSIEQTTRTHTHTHTGIASGQREEHEVEPARRPARPKREEVEKAVRAARLLKALIQRHGHGKLELRSSASAANEMVTGCLDADSMIRDFARRAQTAVRPTVK
jgi:hypothetical protein